MAQAFRIRYSSRWVALPHPLAEEMRVRVEEVVPTLLGVALRERKNGFPVLDVTWEVTQGERG
jgi:hypothetical protein